jgi:hypothetical protein
VIALLMAGNLFCMACPFTLPRDLARKVVFPRYRWPRRLRSKWVAAGLLATYLWGYEAFALWDSPRSTAWIIVGYFIAAFVVDIVFKGASFCKYVCPIGQFHFVHALVSPLQVKVREPAICGSCVTHDCIRGNDRQRGCELRLFQPKKLGNFDCTFCLDCVHACPQQNVGILLDEHHRPRFVAGVPPDYFSAQGQLWGNPVYNWDVLGRTGYRWCLDRLRALLAHVDVIRLDHFRAFVAARHIPAGAPTAQTGAWSAGPAADFFEAVTLELGSLPFIAEDLGLITPDVTGLRDRYQMPGMRVLQFGFDGDSGNPHLPNNFVHNTIAYTGTHDNNTTRGWFEALSDVERQRIWNYLGRSPGESSEAAAAMIGLAWSSPAALAVAPLQDVLNLGAEARMNVPGRPGGNWLWRCTETMLSVFEWLHDLTKVANRSSDFGHTLTENVLETAI